MLLNKINQNKELCKALKIVWTISVAISLILFTIVFFGNETKIMKTIPTCSYKLQGKECFMCGSTRAFFEIKHLSFGNAFRLNRFSPILFTLLLVNISIFSIKRLVKSKSKQNG